MSTLVPEMFRSTLRPLEAALGRRPDDYQELLDACALIAAGGTVLEAAIRSLVARGGERRTLVFLLQDAVEALDKGLQQLEKVKQIVAAADIPAQEQAGRLEAIARYGAQPDQFRRQCIDLLGRLDHEPPSIDPSSFDTGSPAQYETLDTILRRLDSGRDL